MHELIDREDPRCLYCQSEVDIDVESERFMMIQHNVDIIKCRLCKEIFEIHSENESSNVVYCMFTCQKLAVLNSYEFGFSIGKKELLWEQFKKGFIALQNLEYVPAFKVDFSNKSELLLKLKTLILFS